MGSFEKANDLAILAGGRKPEWEEQTAYDGAPASASSGVALGNVLEALVTVAMRAEVHRRTATITITTLDLLATYVVTISGNAATYDAAAGGAADEEDVILGIAAAMAAAPAVAALVTATTSDEDDDGADDTITVVGVGEADYTITIAATLTGVLACVADPTTAGMRVFTTGRTVGSATPAGWRHALNASYTLDYRGFMERFGVGGLGRLYVELHTVDGAGDGASVTYNPTVHVGPCVLE